MDSFTLTGKDTKPEYTIIFCISHLMTISHLHVESTLCDLKQGMWSMCLHISIFFIADTFTAYHLNCKFYINCLKLGNLSIHIGVTRPKLHTSERYLLLSDILAKGLVLHVNRKP